MKPRPSFGRCWWVFTCWSLGWLCTPGSPRFAEASYVLVNMVEPFPRERFRAESVAYGRQLREGSERFAVLMRPPLEEPQLCQLPQLERLRDPPEDYSYQAPLALLVGLGAECSFTQQVKVGLSLGQSIPEIQVLIFYNNDPSMLEEIVTPKLTEHVDGVDDMIYLFISTSAAARIHTRIDNHWIDVNATNPHLLAPNSMYWQFKIIMKRMEDLDSNRFQDDVDEPQNLEWLRYIMFIVLIGTPLLRIIYLWYATGGRIRLRYDQDGRVVGLQYTPPMPIWNPRRYEGRQPTTDTITRQQFQDLPEIVYNPTKETTEDDQSQQPDDDICSKSTTSLTLAPSTLASESDEQLLVPTTTTNSEPQHQQDEEQGVTPPESPDLVAVDTESTDEENDENQACSICIEDFVPGEHLRLLPKCGHFFHSDCIEPWLTSRQGCCPLCKVNVLGDRET